MFSSPVTLRFLGDGGSQEHGCADTSGAVSRCSRNAAADGVGGGSAGAVRVAAAAVAGHAWSLRGTVLEGDAGGVEGDAGGPVLESTAAATHQRLARRAPGDGGARVRRIVTGGTLVTA